MADLNKFFETVDSLKPEFIQRLADAVAIPSVSADAEHRPEVVKMAEWTVDQLKALGAHDIELRELGVQEGTEDLQLPPVVLAKYGNDANKKNILIYGHLDVQPALKEDGWNTDPFVLTVDEEKDVMYGRGSTDDKGPVIGWLNAIEAYKKAGLEFPVNLVMCFEGMEESGSLGLEQLVFAEGDKYFKGVDAVCISDNYWLGTTHPVLTYGLRGCNYYAITITGPGADLHSGVFGGIVNEPMIDLSKVLATLVDGKGKIQIEGVDKMVAPVTEEERSRYDDIHYDIQELTEATGGKDINMHSTKEDTLMARWRYPSLSIHGIEGAFSGAGAKTVIPAKVSGKFSIRTVPNINSKMLDELVFAHVEKEFAKLGSKCKLNVELVHDGDYWVSDPNNWNFTAAKKATKAVWGVEPDLTREGGSIPITLIFEQATKSDVLLLPMGRGDDGAHSINEKLNISNYIGGVKTLGAYLHYIAEEKKE
ncbi:Cys-Gly metallodipeptidase DUG1 [Yarrowia sp. C11]|nr:Cys-Gly metallodipeptidase DUG1 [Yarrowia sp. C11]KAG5364401.1 Cys-Gly metallodipeptidase DUG1 [Yarrowia sp. E02]